MRTPIFLLFQALAMFIAWPFLENAGLAQPPTENLALWLRADAGVTTNLSGTVTAWADQVGGDPNDAVNVGTPKLVEVTFPSEPRPVTRPVIRFDGRSGFTLANDEELQFADLSIYVMGSVNANSRTEIFIANYRDTVGWGLGISDGIINRVKWFTAPPNSMEPEGAQLTPGAPYQLTATFTTTEGGEKRLYVNRSLVGSAGDLTLGYDFGQELTVGVLAGGRQYLTGDIAEVLVYSSVSDTQRAAVEDYLYRRYFNVGTGPAVITRQPESQRVAELDPVTFSVGVDGEPPIRFQWRRNGADLPDATNAAYSIASVTRADQNAQFSVQVSNALGSATSSNAVLTVEIDNAPPVLLSATRGFQDATKVAVVFSEPLTAITATNLAHYAINGVTISQVEVGPNASTVVLTTSPITPGPVYTLTVNGIQDRLGNLIAANDSVSIGIPGATARPPDADMKLWLKADTGVATSGTDVTGWADQAGGVKNDGVSAGLPQLATAAGFPSGPHPVIRLDGASGLVLDNVHDVDIPTLSVYVIASVDPTALSGTFISNIRDPFGFNLGLSDTTAARVRWYTGVPAHSMEPGGANLTNRASYLITGTFNDGAKKLFVNGSLLGSETGLVLNNATENALTVGCQGVYPLGYEESGAPPDLSRFLQGDLAEVLVYSTVSEAQRLAVEAYLHEKYFSQPAGPVVISAQPQSQRVPELAPVTLAVKVDGAPPLSFQWFRNGTLIPGAQSLVYTLEAASRTDAGQYSVRVSNALGSVTSSNVVLTVDQDDTPPTLVSAERDFLDSTQVLINFSEPVSSATATMVANYAINGVTLSGAAMGATPRSVVLTASAITFGPTYTLTVNGIQDLVGNRIAPNSQQRLAVPDPNAPVPNTDLKLWLRADLGVTADPDGRVTAWADRAGGVSHDSEGIMGNPLLTEFEFPSGPHPVVYFDGLSGVRLLSDPDMRLAEMTIYAVITIDVENTGRIFIGNYQDVAGWGLGISDGIPGRVKWFTAPPQSMEPEGAQLTPGIPYLLTATYRLNGDKRLYVNTNLVGSASGVLLTYAAGTELTVGFLQGNRQYHMGNIAEILVYSSVSDSQRAIVEDYLQRKYITAGSGPVVFLRQPQSQRIAELQPVTFEVAVEGAPPFTFQWLRNGAPIEGATALAYTIPSVTRNDQGVQFSVRVSNSLGTVTSSNAVLMVDIDNTPPALVSAQRDFLDATQVTVVFSEPVSAVTATVAANYAINNGATVSQAVMGENSSTVVLTTSALTGGPAYALTVNGVQDLAGNPVAANAQISVQLPLPARVQDAGADGLVVIEAERFDRNVSAGGSTWTLTTASAGYSGEGAMQALPNAGLNVNIDITASPHLDYAVTFVKSGMHYIWVRGLGDSAPGPSGDDSVNVGLDGQLPDTSDRITPFTQDAGFVWNKETAEGPTEPARFEVSAGSHVVNVFMREDAFIIDKLLLTTNPNYTPSGMGPTDTRPGPQPPRLAVAWAGNNLMISWTGGGILQSANQVTGPWADVAGAANPLTVTPSESSKFYRLRR